MTKYAIESKTLTDIANAIRGGVLEDNDTFTPAQMPEKIEQAIEIHRDSAYQMGWSEAIGPAVEQGKQEAYDAFWDAYQNNGNRTDYYAGFAGAGWTKELFNPKHPIKPSGSAYGIFQKSLISGDLVEIAKEQNIEIDFTNATVLQYAFASTAFTRIGVIDASNCTSLIRAFEANSSLKIIDKIILNNSGTANLSNAFNQCYVLEEIRFEGVIGTSDINFGSSKLLSHESLMSIINALKDCSGESTAYTCTFGAENLAKLTADEIKKATDKGWTLL